MRPLVSRCCLRKGKVLRQKDPKSSEVPQGITCNLCKRLLRGRISLGLTCQDCGLTRKSQREQQIVAVVRHAALDDGGGGGGDGRWKMNACATIMNELQCREF